MELTIKELAKQIGAILQGDGTGIISRVQGIEAAGSTDITFARDARHLALLGKSKAAAVILSMKANDIKIPQLIADNVDKMLIDTLRLFAPKLPVTEPGIDRTARIGRAKIAESASIGYGVMISDGVEIGEKTIISAGCRIGPNTRIGSHCVIHPNVVVHHACVIADHVVVQSNTVIGSIGFGYGCVDGKPMLFPHNGSVVIEDFVEIGANCCVDRGMFDETRIGLGTKIDNLVQIAHNVRIGKCCLIAGMAGISGSCVLGDGVMLGGQVAISDHVSIGDHARVGIKSLVTHDIPVGQEVFGIPAVEKHAAFRKLGSVKKLPQLNKRLRLVEQEIRGVGCEMKELLPVLLNRACDIDACNTKTMSRLRRTRTIAWAALAALTLVSLISFPYMRAVTDPDEYRIERLVNAFQDGNNQFYISNSPCLEDLRTNRRLLLVHDLSSIIKRIGALAKQGEDCFFLVSVQDLVQIKANGLGSRLSQITEIHVGDDLFVLLTTEKDDHYVRLSEGTP